MTKSDGHPDVVFSLVAATRKRGDEIGPWIDRLADQADQLNQPWELIVVVDGSDDADVAALRQIARRDASVRMVALRETVGPTRATLAGIEFARGRAVICVDAVGWTPASEIPQLVARWREGFEIVAPARIELQQDDDASAEEQEDVSAQRGTLGWHCRLGWREVRRNIELALTRPQQDTGLGLMLLDVNVVATLRTDPLGNEARTRLLDGPWRVSRIRPMSEEGSGRASYVIPPLDPKEGDYQPLLREAWRAVVLLSAGVCCLGAIGIILGTLLWLVTLFQVSSGFAGFLAVTLLGALGVVVGLQMRQINQLRRQIVDWPRYAVAETEGFQTHAVEDVPPSPSPEAIEQAISIYT